jgi:hypothetical protein
LAISSVDPITSAEFTFGRAPKGVKGLAGSAMPSGVRKLSERSPLAAT